MIKGKLFTVCLLFISIFVQSQKQRTDSLKHALIVANDSIKCLILIELIEIESDNTVWPKYNDDLKRISSTYTISSQRNKRNYFLKAYSDALNNDAFLFQEKGDFNKAFKIYREALEIKLDINDRIGTANTLGNIGYLYQILADYENAIRYHNKSLKIQEENNEIGGASTTLVNLASISLYQNDTAQYLALINKALKNRILINDQLGIARCYNNLAIIEGRKPNKNLAFEYCNKALAIFESLDYKEGVGNTYNNLAALYSLTGNFDKSLELYAKALKINRDVQDHSNTATSLNNIADVYLSMKQIDKAKRFYEEALVFAKLSGGLHDLENITYGLYITNKKLKNPEIALEMLERHLNIKDSISKKAEVKKALAFTDSTLIQDRKVIIETTNKDSSVNVNDQNGSSGLFLFSLLLFCLLFSVVMLVLINMRKH